MATRVSPAEVIQNAVWLHYRCILSRRCALLRAGARDGECAALALHIVLIAPEVPVRYRCSALTAEIGEGITCATEALAATLQAGPLPARWLGAAR